MLGLLHFVSLLHCILPICPEYATVQFLFRVHVFINFKLIEVESFSLVTKKRLRQSEYPIYSAVIQNIKWGISALKKMGEKLLLSTHYNNHRLLCDCDYVCIVFFPQRCLLFGIHLSSLNIPEREYSFHRKPFGIFFSCFIAFLNVISSFLSLKNVHQYHSNNVT